MKIKMKTNRRFDKRRLVEWGKNLLIAALAVSALMLSGIADTARDFIGGETYQPRLAGTGTSSQHSAASHPLTVMVTSAANAHYGVKYDSAALDEVYTRFTASLGEAIGSAGEPEQVTVSRWEEALRGPGVYFDYLYEQSLAAVARWLGVDISSAVSAHTARRICLALEADGAVLYYIRERDGLPYRCTTALNASSLNAQLSGYMPNGAAFVFEQDSGSVLDPYYVALPELADTAELTAANPLAGSDGSGLLELFGMDSYVINHYSEQDGTQVYVEGDNSLRLTPEGGVIYSSLGAGMENGDPAVATADAIDRAYALASSMPGGESCRLQMSRVDYSRETNEYTVCFDYVANGMVICQTGREAAMEITVSGEGEITGADLFCRSYTEGGSVTPMPERQAAAVIAGLGGGEPMLAYIDTAGTVAVKWVVMD